MTKELRPYIEACSFCGNGLLRFRRCMNCNEVVALCDECELMWSDVEGVADDPNLSSESTWPTCPSCGIAATEFDNVTLPELEERQLDRFSAGESV